MGHHVDGLKFAGGSFLLMPEKSVTGLIDIAHQHDIYVSTVSSRPHSLDSADKYRGRLYGACPYASGRY